MAGLVRGHKGLVYPTNFAVSEDTATVQIGYPYQIPYTITPTNATNQKINWTSSNTSIATVDNKGVITAVSTGTCTITGVYSYDGTTVTVTVTTTEVHTTGVSLDKHSLELNEGGIDWLHATLTPSNTSYPGITWSSSDTNVATVSSSGTVKYVGGGTCTITCTTVDGGYTDTCSVTCLVKVESVELNEHSININPNGTHQLTATVLPNNASDKSVTWSSSDTSIATVNNTGLVTYVGAGTCTITVTTTDGGFTDTCEAVCGIPVTGVSLNYSSGTVQANSPLQLVATITPSDASNKNVIWSSSNSSIATVSNNGLVTYVTNGSCTITCTTVDGGFTATCSITCVNKRKVCFLLVGGGGGGSQFYGGGGGGGGVIQCTNYEMNAGNYSIVIGAGGSGVGSYCNGYPGGNSTFNGFVAYGGGYGGGSGGVKGGNGGSGGGAGYGATAATCIGCGCSGQGYNGGCSVNYGSGGGGGAGGAGATGTACYGGLGGAGIASNISGTTYYYSPGGSGHSGYGRNQGGNSTGGAASGPQTTSNATCYGGGGGGTSTNASYGQGKSGIFILAYPSSCGYNISGGTKYLCNGNCIHCFTGNGTLIIS